MSKISLNATQEELQLLADSISQCNLADKVTQMQNQETSSYVFANGDIITLKPGYARVSKAITVDKGERKVTPYLVFGGSAQHSNGSVEDCSISLRQLVTPTIVVNDPGESITRNQLVKRFGSVTVSYRDTHDSNGHVVTLPYLDKEVKLHIVTGTVWVPKFDGYDKESKSWTPEVKENYGYVKPQLNRQWHPPLSIFFCLLV